MKRIIRLANEYIESATEQMNANPRLIIPAEVRLASFVIARGLSRATHAAMYQYLCGVGIV